MKKDPIVVIINDCHDDNARARQTIRTQTLFSTTPTFIGVSNDLEAGGNIVESIDAMGDSPGVILANVAPRGGSGAKHKNGTPFCFFWHKNILVVSTLGGLTLSLVERLGITKEVQVIDIEKATEEMAAKNYIPHELIAVLPHSQFRSYDFSPRVAKYLFDGHSVTSTPFSFIESGTSCPDAVWLVDCFGNCKTTLLQRHHRVKFKEGNTVETAVGPLICVKKLSDVKNDTPALVVGSSGLGKKRFVEIMWRGKSAAEKFGLKVGSPIF